MLSIAMMVKNEEKNIEKSLRAISKLNDSMDTEIIIVDTGSSDNTVAIAKKYTDKVFFHKWEDDFAKMRNITLSYCIGDWILVLDADEVLENPEEIIRLFNSKEIERYNTATVKIKSYTNSLEKNNSIGNIYRLFRQDINLKYVGIIHERPLCKIPILKSEITFSHNGYINDDYELMEYKFKRNTKLLLKHIEENGDDIYSYYQLSQSYFVAERTKEAIFYINKAINMIGKDYNLFKKHLYVFTTYYKELYAMNNYEKCIEVCKKVMMEDKNIIDTYYLLSSCYYNKNNYKESIEYGEKYLRVKNNRSNPNIDIEEFSLEREDDIIEIIVSSYRKLEEYHKVYNLLNSREEDLKKDTLLEAYCSSLIILGKVDELKEVIKNNENKNIYNYIINSINIKLMDSHSNSKKEIAERYLRIDEKIDIYIKVILMDEKIIIDKSIIDFNDFSIWKAELLSSLIKDNDCYIEILNKLNYQEIKQYLAYVTKDYGCIKILIDFSKGKIFTSSVDDLIILDHIEESLVQSNRIIGDDFKSLVNRRIINKYNLMNKIYNPEILSMDICNSVLTQEEMFWYKLRKILSEKENDLEKFIISFREHVKEFKAYKEVYKVIQDEIERPLDESIKIEKKKIIDTVNELVNLGEIQSAKEVIKELKSIAGIDSEIYNVEGVINYIEGDTYKSLDNFLKGYLINDTNNDIIYNINEILLKIRCDK